MYNSARPIRADLTRQLIKTKPLEHVGFVWGCKFSYSQGLGPDLARKVKALALAEGASRDALPFTITTSSLTVAQRGIGKGGSDHKVTFQSGLSH